MKKDLLDKYKRNQNNKRNNKQIPKIKMIFLMIILIYGKKILYMIKDHKFKIKKQ